MSSLVVQKKGIHNNGIFNWSSVSKEINKNRADLKKNPKFTATSVSTDKYKKKFKKHF